MELDSWVNLSDEELLEKRISDLQLKVEGTKLERMVRQLHRELKAKGLAFLPSCHVGDEWFCPEGIPAIFVPFFLVHDRLRKLERKLILEVEGADREWCMQLLRHEAGHAYSYAYKLYRRKAWQQTFGLASTEMKDTYRPRPYSRSYVIHLDDWYAQSHPDEDFAETFAVWLTPGLDWRARFRGWKALAKLEYVDRLMKTLAGKPAPYQPAFRPSDYSCLKIKLKTYYTRKRKLYEEDYPDFYDKDLVRLFVQGRVPRSRSKASSYLESHRKAILDAVCLWTNERRYQVDRLLGDLMQRCDQLNLSVREDDGMQHLQVASYVTTCVMNYLFTGKFKRSK